MKLNWTQIRDRIDGVFIAQSVVISREKKKKKKKKSHMMAFWSLSRDYPYISTSKMSNVCILVSTCKGS